MLNDVVVNNITACEDKGIVISVLESLEGLVWIKGDNNNQNNTCNDWGVFTFSWKLSKRFMAESTFFNVTIFFLIVFLWTYNRQTHIKKTKGSKISHARRRRRQQRHKNKKSFLGGGGGDDADDEHDDDDHDSSSTMSSSSESSDLLDDEDDSEEGLLLRADDDDGVKQQQQQQQQEEDDSEEVVQEQLSESIKSRNKKKSRKRRMSARLLTTRDLRRKSRTMKKLVTTELEQDDDDYYDDKEERELELQQTTTDDDDADADADHTSGNEQSQFPSYDGSDSRYLELDDELETDAEIVPPVTPTAGADAAGTGTGTSATSTPPAKGSTEESAEKRFLWNVMKKVKVFSYLNENAQKTCLEYIQYVDLPNKGDRLFDQNEYDGSLYAVISGKVRCRFHNYLLPTNYHAGDVLFYDDDDDDDDDDDEDSEEEGNDSDNNNTDPNESEKNSNDTKFLTFSSGPGHVVTPLLGMLGGLVYDHMKKQSKNNKDEDKNENINKNIHFQPLRFTNGISVVAKQSNTRLVRVPPHAFSVLLNKYPIEVHRIVQSVICRVQRVSIQILVRTLGLREELFAEQGSIQRQPIQGFNNTLWNKFINSHQQKLHNYSNKFASDDKEKYEDMRKDAAMVAAVQLGFTDTTTTEYDQIVQLIMEQSEITSAPQGETLIQTGEPPDACYLLLQGKVELGLSIPTKTIMKTKTKSKAKTKTQRSINPKVTIDTIPEGSKSNTKATGSRPNLCNRKAFKMPPRTITTTTFHRKIVVQPGCIVAAMAAFTGDISLFTYRCCLTNNKYNQNGNVNQSSSTANDDCIFLKIPTQTFQQIISRYPRALIRCLDTFFQLLSPIVHLLSWNSDWMYVKAAQPIAYQADLCDSMYMVLNGRLRVASNSNNSNAFTTSTSSHHIHHNRHHHHGMQRYFQEEYGRGKCIGDVEGLTRNPWPYDVYAIRNSEVARVPIKTLVTIIAQFPQAGLHLAKSIALRVQSNNRNIMNSNTNRSLSEPKFYTPTFKSSRDIITKKESSTMKTSRHRASISTALPSYGLSLATIAVVPLTPDIDLLSDFCTTLQSALTQIAPTKLMTKKMAQDSIGEKLSRSRKMNSMHDLRMSRLLGELEENSRLVVYQADIKYTWWTRLCIQQADAILLVVTADKAPEYYRVEQCLRWAYESMDVRIDIVVVAGKHHHHYTHSNHNLNIMNQQQTNTEEKVEDQNNVDDDDYYEDDEEVTVSDQLNNWFEERKWLTGQHLVRQPFHRHQLDFSRLCRRITGLSVGLVLGGGGARGIAHLGIIKALMEAGVTIDMVGGTSQGAFIGALFAKTPDNFEEVLNASRDFANKMSSSKEVLMDLTLPITSLFHGRRFNYHIRRFFRRMRVQDLVLNYFCMSTDLQKREQVVHTKGNLWKYVRASMSLTPFFPPIAEKGSLLVDGGYTNVVPADVMKYTMGARTVIAVDVSPEDDIDYTYYGNCLSGWYVLYNSWNPFVKTIHVPSMGDLSETLRWVSSEIHRKNIVSVTDLHIVPKPVQHYGTRDYQLHDEIVEKGYRYAKPIIDEWVQNNPWLVSTPAKSKMNKLHPKPAKS